MHRMDAIAWVLTVCSDCIRLSQAKTLAALVAAAMGVQRISLANIGRAMDGTAKHPIKRCWRFCANEHAETADAMRGIAAKLLKKRKKKLLIALDWWTSPRPPFSHRNGVRPTASKSAASAPLGRSCCKRSMSRRLKHLPPSLNYRNR